MNTLRSSAFIAFSALLLPGLAVLLTPSRATAAPGEIYISNYLENTIDIIGAGSTSTTFAAAGVLSPQGIAFDASGNLFVANNGNNTIEKITPGGAHSIFAHAGSGLNGPFGLAFDSKGDLYVSNSTDAGDNILRFTPAGAVSVFANSAKGIAEPLGLAFDSKDNLYVANEGFENILRITPEGNSTVFAATGTKGLEYPFAVTFSASGDLYVVNNSSRGASILRFTPGGVGEVFADKGLIDPQGLVFGPGGELYVTDEQGFVESYGAGGGAPTRFFSGSGGYPVGIAVSPAGKAKVGPVTVKAKVGMAVEGGTPGSFVFSRPPADAATALKVAFKLSGTAKEGVDYREVKSPLVIPAGATQAKVSIVASGTMSGAHKVTLTLLASPTGAYTLGTPKMASITVIGKD